MSTIQFDEQYTPSFKSRSLLGLPQTPGMVAFLVNKKIVSSEKKAWMFLVTVAGVFLLAATYIFLVYVLKVHPFSKSPEQQAVENREIFERNAKLYQEAVNNQ